MNETTINLQLSEPQKERIGTLIDIFYISNLVWLYIFSLVYPLFGIIVGSILYSSALTNQTKKIGRICIILGAVNIILAIVFVFIIFAAKDFFNEMRPLYL
ncbi:MAG: hypothetical protein ABIK73_03380 [candidate division WOR-3 bacterium]